MQQTGHATGAAALPQAACLARQRRRQRIPLVAALLGGSGGCPSRRPRRLGRLRGGGSDCSGQSIELRDAGGCRAWTGTAMRVVSNYSDSSVLIPCAQSHPVSISTTRESVAKASSSVSCGQHTRNRLPAVAGFVSKDVAAARARLAHIVGQLAAHESVWSGRARLQRTELGGGALPHAQQMISSRRPVAMAPKQPKPGAHSRNTHCHCLPDIMQREGLHQLSTLASQAGGHGAQHIPAAQELSRVGRAHLVPRPQQSATWAGHGMPHNAWHGMQPDASALSRAGVMWYASQCFPMA